MTTTIGEALDSAQRQLRLTSGSPNADAQLLLSEAMARPRAWIIAHQEGVLAGGSLAEFETMLSKVLGGMALPHVLGWWEFYGRRFELNPEVLVPRPETELMVEEALRGADPGSRILDLGTGSGCIAITLALELPKSRACASDLSLNALKVARRNVESHGVGERVFLVNSHLLEALAGHFDLVCANLPYVAADRLPMLEVASREPNMALDGGMYGTELIEEAIEGLPRALAPGGRAVFEIDPDQVGRVRDQAESAFPKAELRIEQDLAGLDRLLILET